MRHLVHRVGIPEKVRVWFRTERVEFTFKENIRHLLVTNLYQDKSQCIT